MKFVLTKKDVIALNEEFEEGVLSNEPSLDFSLSYAKKTENWTKALAFLVRAILLDHVFEDGNKRTAAAVIMTYLDINNMSYNKDKIGQIIIRILKKKIWDNFLLK